MLPRPIELSAEQMDAIDARLENMYWETGARCLLLADITGQLISEQGAAGKMNTAVLSALGAGELAATKELARLVGEEARFRMVLHEGSKSNIYLSEIGEDMLLITVFDTETPIGMIRLFTKELVTELAEIIAQSRHTSGQSNIHDLDGLDALLAQELDDALSGQ